MLVICFKEAGQRGWRQSLQIQPSSSGSGALQFLVKRCQVRCLSEVGRAANETMPTKGEAGIGNMLY